ncbi:MAG: hypothetical protein R3346_04950 [Candidatus Spechtbacterales bacterium]|nr:hypothetical protein [Candidatus Spechtbacterales bacterium]
MSIDTEYKESITGIKYTPIREWSIDNHNVAWMKYEGINIHDEPFEGEDLYCECDFSDIKDGFHCEAKKKIREQVQAKTRKKYLHSWKKMGKKRAVYNIFRRVQRGEWLGQKYPRIIYVQEVASLLGKDNEEIVTACEKLFLEEKLDLNGMILSPFVKRFRFPREIQALFTYIIEEPLGWPNGDAGDGFVYSLESAIHQNTRFKDGKVAFYSENYPNIAPHHLINFGLRWIHQALNRASNSKDALQDIAHSPLEDIAEHLEQLAETCRDLHQDTEQKNPD